MASAITGRASDVNTGSRAKSERCVKRPGRTTGGSSGVPPSSGADELQIFSWRMGSKKTPAKVPKEESRGEDMFEDLVTHVDVQGETTDGERGEEGGGERRASKGGADRRASFG